MTWGLQSLQAVWWAGQPIQADPAVVFQQTIGTAPEATQSNAAASTSLALGQRHDKQWRFQRQANRLDFIVNQSPAPGVLVPLISDVPGAITDFGNKIATVSNHIPAANRLAMVAIVSQVVASMDVANQQVTELSGITLPYDDLTDLVLQLNRKKQLPSLANLEINRVLKWLGEGFQIVEVTSGIPEFRTASVASVSVDVNTAPVSGRTFQSAEQITIFSAIGNEVERLCRLRNLTALSE